MSIGRMLALVAVLALVGGLWGSWPVMADGDAPPACDAAATVVTVTAPAAFIHTAPRLDAAAPVTVPKGTLLGVVARQAAEKVGCWYQVTVLQTAARTGQPALPNPAWIAGSTVQSAHSQTATPIPSGRSQASMSVPSASPTPVAPTPMVPTPVAPYSVPSVPTTAPPSAYVGAPVAPTYAPGPTAPQPTDSPVSASAPLVPGDPGVASPAPTAAINSAATGIDAPVRRVVTTRVCLDRNANNYCDLDEGVAGVPAYVVGPSGQVLAATRTDSSGVASAVVEVPRTAQLTINVPYLNAYQRVNGLGDTPPILVPMNAPLPGAMP